MNIYLCSTLRHFLFATLKSLSVRDELSHIIVITDQQGLDPNRFELSVLPSTISVKFVERKQILDNVYGGKLGFVHKLFATANISSKFFQERTLKKLDECDLLSSEYGLKGTTLYLFNDRNRLARLMRLAFIEYEVIEDGLSNYTGSELSLAERYVLSKKGRRFIGDDKRCSAIHLLTPKLAASQLAPKVKPINFISYINVNSFIYPLFKVDKSKVSIPEVIIATQPISIGNMIESECDIAVFQKIVDYLKFKDYSYAFKVHPRENEMKYRIEFPDTDFIESKIPLELLAFSSCESPIVLSIYSSAGMGFEEHCRRATLIKDEEAEYQADIYAQWQKDLIDVDKRLERIL
ncbi:glycosyltransferase family 52 [Vibrio lentus]|uniref:glycosyltransferase family 52 n=1 Tax=Vibrio lentus TaxID=136468 RepID=UPI00178CE45B|nr:glycosyltransferase family 52 [Vibrio lentus]MDN3632415.1 glycosyltransferase family 52 [Vibrio lentus]